MAIPDNARRGIRYMGFLKPPAREEVKAYCELMNVPFEKFYSHYERAGWVANGYPIANWKLLVETWAENKTTKNRFDYAAQRDRTPEEWLELERELLLRSKAKHDADVAADIAAGRAHIYEFDCVGGHYDIFNGFVREEK